MQISTGRKKKLLLYMEKDAPVAVGDDIEVRGILEKPERASNPGQFDGASYYRSKGIAYIMRRMVIPLSVKEILTRRCLIK